MNDNSNQMPHVAWHYRCGFLREADRFAKGTVLRRSTVNRARHVYLNLWSRPSAFATGVDDLGDGRFDIQHAVEVVPLVEYDDWDTMVADLGQRYELGIAGTIYCDGRRCCGFMWINPTEPDRGLSRVAMTIWCEVEKLYFPMLVIAVPRQ